MTIQEIYRKINAFYFYNQSEAAAEFLQQEIASFDWEDDDEIEEIFTIACGICRQEDVLSLEILLAQPEFDVNRKVNGETLLTSVTASVFRNLKFLQHLIAAGADITVSNRQGETVLSLALQHRILDVSCFLAECLPPEHMYQTDRLGRMPFHHACEQEDLQSAAIFLKKGFDINTPCGDKNANVSVWFDYTGRTALQIACVKGLVSTVEFLLQNGADAELGDRNCKKPLFYAIDIDEERKRSQSIPAYWQAIEKRIEIIRLLCRKGADLNVKNDEEETVLLATLNGWRFANGIGQEYEQIAMALIDCGADLQVSNQKGQTPLHFAVQYAFRDLTKHLLSHSVDLNARDQNGSTPLHYAVSANREKMVKRLIKQGADREIPDNKGRKPLEIASEKGYLEIVELLLG